MEQESKRPLFAHLQYEIADKLDISWAEYVLLDMVATLSLKDGYCYKSITSISHDLRLTFTGTKKMIQRLISRELLLVHGKGLVCGQAYLDLLVTDSRVRAIKTELSLETELSLVNRGSKTELSSKNRTKFNETELSSDKNNNRTTKNNKKTGASAYPDLEPELQAFMEMRKALRKPLTPTALKLVIGKLTSWYPDDTQSQKACLNQSTENSWVTVYQLKQAVRERRFA